jgi:hypothetical protein
MKPSKGGFTPPFVILKKKILPFFLPIGNFRGLFCKIFFICRISDDALKKSDE